MKNPFNDKEYDRRKKLTELKKEYQRKCPYCGWLNTITNKYKKRLCWNCGRNVYLNKEDEFKDKMKELLK